MNSTGHAPKGARVNAALTALLDTKAVAPGSRTTGSSLRSGPLSATLSRQEFTDIQAVETAYLPCVDANAGVNGHPIAELERTEFLADAVPAPAACAPLLDGAAVGAAGHAGWSVTRTAAVVRDRADNFGADRLVEARLGAHRQVLEAT